MDRFGPRSHVRSWQKHILTLAWEEELYTSKSTGLEQICPDVQKSPEPSRPGKEIVYVDIYLFNIIITNFFLTQTNIYQSRRTEQKAPSNSEDLQVAAEIPIYFINTKIPSPKPSGDQELEVAPCNFENFCTPAFA